MSRILIHVQYLKGIGHLQRMKLIAEATASLGAEVHIASGGLPLPNFAPSGVQIHQLPPLQAGPGGFADLRDESGQRVDDAWRAKRRDRLL
ncbi:MAG: glycosyl transferase, partial [Hyphomicrobiales bacterium]|nr:glycosyl transferase [Hyphomicrobiales bacterium]